MTGTPTTQAERSVAFAFYSLVIIKILSFSGRDLMIAPFKALAINAGAFLFQGCANCVAFLHLAPRQNSQSLQAPSYR